MRRRAFLGLGALLPAATFSPALLADEVGELRARGALRVGTSDDYAPFAKAASGRRAGLDVDMIALLAKDLGVHVEYVPFKWPELTTRLEQKSFDLAASGVTMRADRLFFGAFSRPYAVTGAVACIRKEDAKRLGRAAELDSPTVRIAVNRGGHLAYVARTTFPRATLELIDDNTTLLDRVVSKSVDAAVSDSAEVHAAARPELVTVGPFTRDRKAFYVRRDEPELARYVDDWLFKHESDLALAGLRRRWLGNVVVPGWNPHLEAVLADVQLRLDLMPGVGAAKRVLGMPVEDRDQEARVVTRVRDLATAELLDPAGVETLYRGLIRAAKIIQLAPVLASPTTTLGALRDAIGGLDEHLVRGLKTAAPRVTPAAWQKGVESGLTAELLPKALLGELATALGGVHRVQGKTG
ncbi:MAG TPA: transporter substrate-binding domain-containing protein [Polyangiaceae bacterium]|jgi:cyclohexadienyl dehydratase|nr:transporter substrate-binding domain-containing protein [Polyangiaceae bacterium]